MAIPPIVIYVDGACKGNPGVGGWGAHLQYPDGRQQDYCGGAANTTNNRMEITAALQALAHSPSDQPAIIWTDSSYVQQGISQWIKGWKSKNWRKSDGSALLNADLWQQLDAACQGRNLEWRWVKGHAGNAGNERADQLANQGVEKMRNPNSDSRDNGSNSNSSTPTEKKNLASERDWLQHDPLGFEQQDDFDADLEASFDADLDGSFNAEFGAPPEDLWQGVPDLADAAPDTAQPVEAPRSATTPTQPNQNSLQNQNSVQNPTRQLILDTETTGFEPHKGDRVIEIGVLEMINRKLTGNKMHVYLNPQRPVGESAAIHGLTDDFLQDKPLFASIAQQLSDFLHGGEIIAHNASFDLRFLEAELERCNIAPLAGRVLVTDTLAIAKRKYPAQKNSLDALVKRCDIKPRDRTFHGALLDAEILADVYLYMTGGQVTLDMGSQNPSGDGSHQHQILARRPLPVVAAHPEEAQAHQAWLDQIEQSKGASQTLWRKLQLH